LVDLGQRSGLKCHRVSIGAMRLPEDDEKAVALMRQAIDAGMIYIDTSRGYGESEIKVGKSLKDGYRDKVILSTKWSPWNVQIEPNDDTSADCTYKRILESMQRLEVEQLDFYQIWSVNNPEQFQQATEKGGMLDGIRRAMEEGLVKHTGFTTHDEPENISRYIDESDWCETILFTHNILNQKYKDVIAKAHEKGIGTIVMNPVAGGLLAEDSAVFREAFGPLPVETAHRYLSGDSNIDTILCGIVEPSDIISTLENYQKPPLSAEERRQVERAAEKLNQEKEKFCTSCEYCKPCPKEINIPAILHAVYLKKMLQCSARAEAQYKHTAEKHARASECIECGKCEEKCPQKLSITALMQYAAETFDKPSQD